MTQAIKTPAFVMDETILRQDIALLRKIADEAACQLLYSPKACSLAPVLEIISESVDGFGCSSPFELELIRRKSRPGQSIHLVSPLLEAETLRPMGGRLDYVTLNSMTQWARLRGKISPKTQTGIRVNPQLSFLNDQRYDPCRPHSKLGVPIHQLAELAGDPTLAGISGLHFHTNCDATDFASLLATVRHIQDHLGKFLEGISWVNMGGGYMFNEAADYGDFFQAVEIFREKHGLQVFIEPGAAMVRRAGSIEASVHDLFDSDEAQVAILDTSVNHMAEIFEFQFEPDVLGYTEGGVHEYILAGCTCLAGDLFGEYSFDTSLDLGCRIKFLNMGAYTMTKAHRFNGHGLPAIYMRRADGSDELIKEDGFDDFAKASGVNLDAVV